MIKGRTYRVIFQNQGKVYEVYAHEAHQSAMYGFIEMENLVFGQRSGIVVDPSAESLAREFEGISRCYIPVHAVVRIDEVDKEGPAKVLDSDQYQGNVTVLPSGSPLTRE